MLRPSTAKKLERLASMKREERKIAALTAYDYPTARLVDECGIDLILVGDSLGMVVCGLEDTTQVGFSMMLHHTRIVARAVKDALLVSDFSYRTYESPAQAVENGRELIEAGAEAVKLEGGTSQLPQVSALVSDGIPVIGHIGMLPQRVREEGGYKKKGKTPAQAEALVKGALDLETAGVHAIVLEGIVPLVAARITRAVAIPTIGIGSGDECDGQILVLHDLLGSFPWFRPGFATPKADLAGETIRAVQEYVAEVKSGTLAGKLSSETV